MRRDLTASAVAIVLCTLLLGLVYPLLTTGVAQILFPNRAGGSQIKRGDKVVGSRLLAQGFSRPVLDAHGKPRKDADGKPVVAPDPRYFQPRPSQTSYAANASSFANVGPNQRNLHDVIKQRIDAYVTLEGPYTPGLTPARIPVDAVTNSGSGVDPHISVANAEIQARRIAAVRRLSLSRLRGLIRANTDGRSLGLFGEPGVNVLELNLALNRAVSR